MYVPRHTFLCLFLRAKLEPWSFGCSGTLRKGHVRLDFETLGGFLQQFDNIMVCSATLYSQVGTLADVDGWCDPRRERYWSVLSANNHILIDSYAVDKA